MDNLTLSTLITRFKAGDPAAYCRLFEGFEALLRLYAYRLSGEDSFQELSLFLIELFYKIDLSSFKSCKEDGLNRYICVSLKHKYIALSKQEQRLKKEKNPYCEATDFENRDLIENARLKEALATLTAPQRKVIVYKYVYQFTDAEIGDMLKISRQAINKTKNRAFKTLKGYYKGD